MTDKPSLVLPLLLMSYTPPLKLPDPLEVKTPPDANAPLLEEPPAVNAQLPEVKMEFVNALLPLAGALTIVPARKGNVKTAGLVCASIPTRFTCAESTT